MKKIRDDEWLNRLFIIVLAIVLVGIIGMNVMMINQMSKSQTNNIGETRLRLISDGLELMLIRAEDSMALLETEVENLLAKDPDKEVIDYYFKSRKKGFQENGQLVINVFGIGQDWIAIPDFEGMDTYDPETRGWYQELMANSGALTVSAPYQDAFTGQMCFTVSTLMDDGVTVVGMDYYLTDIQNTISELCESGEGEALIVGSDGTIVGYSDDSVVGKSLTEELPEYEAVVHHAENMPEESDIFTVRMNNKEYTVFCTRTEHNWYMIYRISSITLYRDTYIQLARNSILNLLFVIGILAFYIYGYHNRKRAENALLAKEKFLEGFSAKFRDPLAQILHLSNYEVLDSATNPKEYVDTIHSSGLQLSAMFDNLFSYSNIVSLEQKKRKTEKNSTNRRIYLLVSFILVLTMLIALGVNVRSGYHLAKSDMNKEAESYTSAVSEWMQTQKTVLSMFANFISESPELLDDYYTTISFLDGITQKYEDISVSYITNPEWENRGVRMNNDWHPDESYRLTERQWYIDTMKSETGMSISDPYYDAQTGLYCITFSQKVYDKEGKFLGIFAFDCYLDKLIGILGNSYSDDGYAFLADASGNIINHPHSAYEMKEDAITWISDSLYSGMEVNSLRILKDYDNNFKVCLLVHESNSDFSIYVIKDLFAVCRSVTPYLLLLLVLFVSCIVIINMVMQKNDAWYEEVTKNLQDSVKAAEEAGQSKTQFLAQMSHEIRTPINAVLGMNEMIRRESNDAEILEYAENINTAGNTLLSLINNILDFSKLDSDRMEIVPVAYDTLPWIDNLVRMIADRAEKKGLLFTTEIDPTLPIGLYGDDVRMTQIITNLLTNALKYTQEGRVILQIKVLEWDDALESVQLRVSVRDTGIGIREEDREKLFESFGRVNLNETRNIEGTGLGIPIVQKLLVLMGSNLCLDSVFGEGSDFYFEITQRIADRTPIGDYEERAKDLQKEKVYEQSKAYVRVPGAKILVVDDNKMNLKVAKGLLRRSEADVTLCGGGHEAIELLGRQRFDLILLDHMMPDIDGVETLHILQKENLLPQDTVVVVMTANAIAGSREKYLAEGFENYLSKPVRVEELEAVLERYLGDKYGEDTVSETGTEAETEGAYTHEELNVLQKQLPELDLATGLLYCMEDEEFYLSSCALYTKEDKYSLLQEYFAAGDWNNYCILVHALKSNSRNIGLTALGEEAFLLEKASRANDAETVKAHHNKTMEHYQQILVTLREAGVEKYSDDDD